MLAAAAAARRGETGDGGGGDEQRALLHPLLAGDGLGEEEEEAAAGDLDAAVGSSPDQQQRQQQEAAAASGSSSSSSTRASGGDQRSRDQGRRPAGSDGPKAAAPSGKGLPTHPNAAAAAAAVAEPNGGSSDFGSDGPSHLLAIVAVSSGGAAAGEAKRAQRARRAHLPLWPASLLVLLTAAVAASDVGKSYVPCGSWRYWLVVLSVVPPALGVTLLARRWELRPGARAGDNIHYTRRNTLIYPAVCSLAGVVAGLFGLGEWRRGLLLGG